MIITCKKATQLLSEQLERPLGFGEKVSLKCHLFVCRGCTNFGEQMTVLRKISREYSHKQGDE
ncbi:zf-HC2 domain-containing protein [Shewanella avicenniae]|uniref:Zf-HC2 domain-containing protein n=1 Tax=Shewanella avicenniae TaxID=2814294 RepID=A0ABX7QRG4_9GAMM|nr:zf-HC2 domain-containing protein [Shewanella avicenniae]QSX33293.1 zf-HC2 domain-containing protein [Shewanella avicenniae]